MSLTKVSFSMIDGQVLNVLDFGADPTGTNDSASAIQAAITANASGGIVFIPKGTYKINTPLVKATSFVGPSLVGEGHDCTILDYTALDDGDACIEYIGGSGNLSSIKIEGLRFAGNNNTSTGTTAIKINGQNNVLISECRFEENFFGVHFYNGTTGSFTEYCVADYCTFDPTCSIKFYYSVGLGDRSFNGSGFRNCMINVNSASGSNNPVVVIEDGAMPYNAPASGQVWLLGPNGTTFIDNKNNDLPFPYNASFYGTLTLEFLSSTAGMNLGIGNVRTFYSGSIVSLGQYWKSGSVTICDHFSVNNDSSTRLLKKTWSIVGTATTGTTTVNLNLPVGDSTIGGAFSCLLYVVLSGVNYQYSHVLSFVPGVTAAGYVATLQNAEAFNSAGWGASTFGVSGSIGDPRLTITNASAGFNVSYRIGIVQVGWGEYF